MSKRNGATRIPMFGSRIPTAPSEELTIGCKVRANDKEGIVRFIGRVHFSEGIWCGIELINALGKHNGNVKGMQYFACADLHGLMTPIGKAILIDDNNEDTASGPHSILLGLTQTYEKPIYSGSPSFDQLDRTYSDNINNHINQFENRQILTIKSNDINNLNITQDIQDIETTYTENRLNSTEIKTNNPLIRSTTFDKTNTPETCQHDTFNLEKSLPNKEIDHRTPDNRRLTFVKSNSNESPTSSDNVTYCENRINSTEIKTNNPLIRSTTYDKTNSFDICEEDINKPLPNIKIDLLRPDNRRLTFVKSNSNESPTSSDETRFLNETCNLSIIQKANFVLENLATTYDTPSIVSRKNTNHSTPLHDAQNDDGAKRDSLEFDESLGILTPDQMIDVSVALIGSNTPSSENLRSIAHDYQADLSQIESSRFSLGILDDRVMLSYCKTDPTMNLPLDKNSNGNTFTRIEQTPSPEDLPFDPTPIQTQPIKVDNKFVTSITSITSLDTGYQGDGEMSRPTSRGADNSPLTRRPIPRPIPRRHDPMTDSDFYTESDADMHEEPIRGDRKAQVIDGTLYGVDPQAAADIYANNRENMDSSGIFTDIERNDEVSSSADNEVSPPQQLIHHTDVSPSDSSTKTISDDSQSNINLISKTPTNSNEIIHEETPATTTATPKRTSPKRITPNRSFSTKQATPPPGSSVNVRNNKSASKVETKTYKTPKRNVQSKVKSLSGPCDKENVKRVPQLKKVGRWDEVLNKMTANVQKKNLKEVKSKVFNSISANVPVLVGSKSETLKSTNNKTKRVRTRAITNSSNKNVESITSSLSDLSGASPAKKNNGSAKKQREVVRVNQVLTAAKLSPKSNNTTNTEAKNKNNTNLNNDVKAANNRNLFSSKEKKKDTKEISRAAIKGGRVSPNTRPPQSPRVPIKQAPRTAEALAVLVQHLVFNLEAFKNPTLKKEAAKARLVAEEALLSCQQLEDSLSEERKRHTGVIGDERIKYRAEINQLIEQNRTNVAQLQLTHQEVLNKLQLERDSMKGSLIKLHENELFTFKEQFEKLQKMHQESLDIIREENDAIRDQLDEKNMYIRELEHYKFESEKLKRDYEGKEIANKKHLAAANDEVCRLQIDNDSMIMGKYDGDESSLMEVQSLRAVLDLKLSEVADLRKSLAESNQKADRLPASEEKVSALMARCEDLQHQLERKTDFEQQLMSDHKKLQNSFSEEINKQKRIFRHNEELQWRLKQNKEVFTKVMEEAEASAFNRSLMSSSFNEKHISSKANFERTLSFRERSLSNKSNTSECSNRSRKSKNSLDLEEEAAASPPNSPKVKGVVEKSDSVSYVLELDESPEVVALQILRRSFRNTTPPKTTPTKSPSNKRPRKNNQLSLSVSASSIMGPTKTDMLRTRSISVRNGDLQCSNVGSSHSDDAFVWEVSKDSTSSPLNSSKTTAFWNSHPTDEFDEDLEDINLPALPSEIGRKLATLPAPKHMAGEAMISESNSEDESSTSSSSAQL